MKRKLFCEISPMTYKISTLKCQFIRFVKDMIYHNKMSKKKENEMLPVLIYRHKLLIRRKLGNVNMQLQENKAVNLSIAAKRITNIVIYPNETFSFWNLVGNTTKRRGYKEGLTIAKGAPSSGIGGGMCQMTNLIHWLVLHTSLEITEHHHHDGMDLFPDFNRQIPFGTGTSIVYNYLDYRFKNTTNNVYQLIVYTDDKYLCGEIRSSKNQPLKYHIKSENEHFIMENNFVFREGEVYRETIDVKTGNCISKDLIRKNHARVMYDTSNLAITHIDNR